MRGRPRAGGRGDFAAWRKQVGGDAPGNSVSVATVGHVDDLTTLPLPNPAFVRVEDGDVYVECTLQPDGDQIVARLGAAGAGAGWTWYVPVEFGCQVVVVFPQGRSDDAVIVARLNDQPCPMPPEVAGLSTGAPGTPLPAPATPGPQFQFVRTPVGGILALESGEGGDLLVHSGGSVEIKTLVPGVPAPGVGPSAIHLNGRTHLGVGPTSPPVPGQTLPAGVVSPSVPAVPYVPIPATPPAPAPPGPAIPYVGFEDGIVRAKDLHQSDVTVDPTFWAFVFGLYAHPLIGPILAAGGVVLPLAATSKVSGLAGPGSQHTASD